MWTRNEVSIRDSPGAAALGPMAEVVHDSLAGVLDSPAGVEKVLPVPILTNL